MLAIFFKEKWLRLIGYFFGLLTALILLLPSHLFVPRINALLPENIEIIDIGGTLLFHSSGQIVIEGELLNFDWKSCLLSDTFFLPGWCVSVFRSESVINAQWTPFSPMQLSQVEGELHAWGVSYVLSNMFGVWMEQGVLSYNFDSIRLSLNMPMYITYVDGLIDLKDFRLVGIRDTMNGSFDIHTAEDTIFLEGHADHPFLKLDGVSSMTASGWSAQFNLYIQGQLQNYDLYFLNLLSEQGQDEHHYIIKYDGIFE